MAETARSDLSGAGDCSCTEVPSTPSRTVHPDCQCPRDEHDILIHVETCFLWRNERIIYPHEVDNCECYEPPTAVCECCACLPDQCFCKKAGREVFDEWRQNRELGALPAVLEASHPLMQKFQQTLQTFLDKENALAEKEIRNLSDKLKDAKQKYQSDLETLYHDDHDTNAQRALIVEYESHLGKDARQRMECMERSRVGEEMYKRASQRLDQEIRNEREAIEEAEALDGLVRQLEKWREETESDLAISQTMTSKMRKEKKALGEEKRELDMIIYGLSNEVWKLQSKMDMYKQQIEVKNAEMINMTDRVTAYATELEDLELDKKRLLALWHSVVMNIKQRDNIYDAVRDDYNNLRENFRTLAHSLDVTKKMLADEINKSKEIAMNKDKLVADLEVANRAFEIEEVKRERSIREWNQVTESIEMSERDMEMIKMENQVMTRILKKTQKEMEHRASVKLKMENQILSNLQEQLLNDKATEAMANGIKKMRDMSRNLEISLCEMENQHAKIMLNIEIHRNRKLVNDRKLAESQELVRAREKELDAMQEAYEQDEVRLLKKQRELDIVLKKYHAQREICDSLSPQELRIIELEQQIRTLRDKTENLQHEWLRLQGHVVKLTTQWYQVVNDITLLNKQVQICDQKSMYNQAQIDGVQAERAKTDCTLRDLRGRLEVLERTRKEAAERTSGAQRTNIAITTEYAANLKDAETTLIELEEDIEALDKQKMDLTQELDHVQREALIWQRKGMLAVELKRNIKNAKSAAGEIGQMKHEIHRMQVRRRQLRLTAERLSDDIAVYVRRRDAVMDRSRASAAVELARGCAKGSTSQVAYQHKLRHSRAEVARVSKEVEEAKARMKQLEVEYEKLEKEIKKTNGLNAQLEEQVASLLSECRETERHKQWTLERVVRSQRLGSELATAVKRQSVRVKKPKPTILADYKQARALNDRIKYIVEELAKNYPHMDERFETISNTLNIFTPDGSPRLTEEAACEMVDEEEAACVIREPEPEVPEDPCHCD